MNEYVLTFVNLDGPGWLHVLPRHIIPPTAGDHIVASFPTEAEALRAQAMLEAWLGRIIIDKTVRGASDDPAR